MDPSLIEEKVMDGKMVIGMNKHREICMLQITGEMLLLKEQVHFMFELIRTSSHRRIDMKNGSILGIIYALSLC